MTAAQKAAKANFKKAIEYRKKTGVSLKEAFAHVYGKKVGAAPKKKAAKKAAPKKSTKKVVKKAAPKKAAKKKHTKYGVVKKHVRRVAGMKKPESVHKDTKSHNVNIRVMSGIGSLAMDKYKKALNEIEGLEKALNRNLIQMKLYPYQTPFWKQRFKITNAKIKSYIKELKTHAKELKKHI